MPINDVLHFFLSINFFIYIFRVNDEIKIRYNRDFEHRKKGLKISVGLFNLCGVYL